jgi:hypothetical protein
LSSVLIFIIGCACGWVGHKHRIKGLDKNTNSQAAPVYEDIASMPRDPRQKATFELKENVAYGPSTSTVNIAESKFNALLIKFVSDKSLYRLLADEQLIKTMP